MSRDRFYRQLGARLILVLFAGWTSASPGSQSTLSLEEAERLASFEEPGFTSRMSMAESLREQAIADGERPDPMLMMGLMNVPLDTFSLNQDPMNQFKVGVRQHFPPGDSLDIRREKTLAAADSMRSNADARLLQVKLATRIAWLQAYFWEMAKQIVQQDHPHFEQLRSITGSYYRVGRKQLQDVIRSELELRRLDDRLVVIDENIDKSRASLARWVGLESAALPFGNELPDWNNFLGSGPTNELVEKLLDHPMINSMDHQIEGRRKGVALAEQNYKPAWSVEVGYSHRRGKKGNGSGVPDLLSAIVSMDLPIFQSKRQDKRLAASQRRYQAAVDQRVEKIRNLTSQLDSHRAHLSRLEERKTLHETLILPQTAQQVEISLLSYEADTSDFAEVMRAYMADLDARLAYEKIRIGRLKSIANLRFLIPPADDRQ